MIVFLPYPHPEIEVQYPPLSPEVLARVWVWVLGELSGSPSHGRVWGRVAQSRPGVEDTAFSLAVRDANKPLLPFLLV